MVRVLSGVCLLMLCALPVSGATVDEQIRTIKSVAARGEGNQQAVKAARELSGASPEALQSILAAMNDADPLAANWLRGAFESIAARAVAAEQLPVAALEEFIREQSHNPRVRRLAFEWLLRADPQAADRFDLLHDRSPEMRRDAVAKLIDTAKGQTGDAARATWKMALGGAVDQDQVDTIAKALKGLGEEFSFVDHFGLLVEWYVIGPFDNKDMRGFPVVYPPEQEIRLDAEYTGQKGPVRWEKLRSEEADGAFDLAKLTAPHKGAIDYLYTEFQAVAEQPVEFRLGTANAWKLWVNGELVFAREEYHRGMQFDQYIVPGKLRPGKNTILLKVCQNEQEQDWAQRWAVQFRICDVEGRALRAAQ